MKLNAQRLPSAGVLVGDLELNALLKLTPKARKRFKAARIAAWRARGSR